MAMSCIYGGECTGCMDCRPEPSPERWCSQCGEPIYPGDDYWSIEEQPWCEECIDQCRREA